MYRYRFYASETVLVNTTCQNEFVLTETSENFKPQSLANNIFSEELSHLQLFPTGIFRFQTKRKVDLTSTKYLNQRLLNYTQKFSSDSDDIYF